MYSSLQGAIIIEQVILEMLSWVKFVESEAVYKRSEFAITRKFPAVEKLRLLISSLDIPLSIPSQLQAAVAAALENNWSIGPQALTVIRNRIVHASPESREQIRDLSELSIFEVWKLGLWYIELILLSLFGYQGAYHNRLRRNRDLSDFEPVPWARS